MVQQQDLAVLRELIVGLAQAQAILIHALMRHGVIRKEDAADYLDAMADQYDKTNPGRGFALALRFVSSELDQAYPPPAPRPPPAPQPPPQSRRPAWFQGVIDGGMSIDRGNPSTP